MVNERAHELKPLSNLRYQCQFQPTYPLFCLLMFCLYTSLGTNCAWSFTFFCSATTRNQSVCIHSYYPINPLIISLLYFRTYCQFVHSVMKNIPFCVLSLTATAELYYYHSTKSRTSNFQGPFNVRFTLAHLSVVMYRIDMDDKRQVGYYRSTKMKCLLL